MVDYNVNVLGGFNLGKAVGDLGEQYQENQRREEMKAAMMGAAKGDPDAIEQLYGMNPQLAMQMESRQSERQKQMNATRAAEMTEAETNLGIKYVMAKTPEEKAALEQEAFNNPLIDFDQSDLDANATQAQKDMMINIMLYKNMGKDAYNQFFGGEKGAEKGTYQVKETPTGYIRLNTATGDVKSYDLDSKMAKIQMEKQKKALEQQLKQEETTFDRGKKLRDEYSTKTKEFQKVDDAFSRVKASTENPDPAGDIALIFNYMKMLDPGSVVREGEFATAQNAGGADVSIRNAYNRLLSGERLNPSQRKMFENRAEKLFSAAKKKADKQREDILGLGKRYNLNEQDIFGIQETQDANVVNWSDL